MSKSKASLDVLVSMVRAISSGKFRQKTLAPNFDRLSISNSLEN